MIIGILWKIGYFDFSDSVSAASGAGSVASAFSPSTFFERFFFLSKATTAAIATIKTIKAIRPSGLLITIFRVPRNTF